MEPLKPEKKRVVLENAQAQPSELEEYERLLSQRFTEDPDQRPAGGPELMEATGGGARAQRELRIKELHRKLFGESRR
jgi:hypothetical protein